MSTPARATYDSCVSADTSWLAFEALSYDTIPPHSPFLLPTGRRIQAERDNLESNVRERG